MTKLITHGLTKIQIEQFVLTPSHALLLYGPAGIGKLAVAKYIARSVLGLDESDYRNYPYKFSIVGPEVSSEAIETVRKLEKFLSLKVPLSGQINRVIIISDAHDLSVQAQNALLKTIEEPPEGTLLILTAPKQTNLLPTITSRSQSIAIRRPRKSDSLAYFKGIGYVETDVNQALAITGGLPGIITALLSDTDHPLKQATELSRQLLQSTVFERLLMTESLIKDKQTFRNVLFILQQMAHSKLLSVNGNQFERWQHILTATYEASEQIENSAQPKLVVDSLLLKLN